MELTNKQEYLMTITKEEKELIQQRLEQVRLKSKSNDKPFEKNQQDKTFLNVTKPISEVLSPNYPAGHSHPLIVHAEGGKDDNKMIHSFSLPTLIKLTEYTKHKLNKTQDVWAEDLI